MTHADLYVHYISGVLLSFFFTFTILWFELIFIVHKYNNNWGWAQIPRLRPSYYDMQSVFSAFTKRQLYCYFFQEKCQCKISLINFSYSFRFLASFTERLYIFNDINPFVCSTVCHIIIPCE